LAASGEVELDIFAEELEHEPWAPIAPSGVQVFRARTFLVVEPLRGGYDQVLFALGNSDNHITALELLGQRAGVVLAHDVRLTNLYYFAAQRHSPAVPDGFADALRRLYGETLPAGLGEGGRLDSVESERHGILMAREVIDRAQRYLVTSREARALAIRDAGAGAAAKIGLVPFAAELPTPGRGGFENAGGEDGPPPPTGAPVVVAPGILDPVRQPLRLLEAFAHALKLVPKARLAFVGPAPGELTQQVLDRAQRLGISERVVVTGQVGTARFLEWLRGATISVQLRGHWNGEASGTVGECLQAGLPVLASNLGWVRELPDNCMVKVDPSATTEALGATLARLLVDRGWREALRDGALAFAPNLSFSRVAHALLSELLTAHR
jgi:glycosyltransferase involved in cell wall biosynthesis